MDTCKKLDSTRTNLLSCKARERAKLKSKYETLGAVLDRLHGVDAVKGSSSAQRDEIASLTLKLNAAVGREKDTAENLKFQIKLNKDLKCQFQKMQAKQSKTKLDEEKTNKVLHSQLKETQVRSASRLSLESAINMDLQNKLEVASKRLQPPPSHMSTQAPEDLSELPLNLSNILSSDEQEEPEAEATGTDIGLTAEEEVPLQGAKKENAPAAETPGSRESLGGLPRFSDSVEDLAEDEFIQKVKQRMVRIKISQLQEITEDAVNQVWQTVDPLLRSQRVQMDQLVRAVKLAQKQLVDQREEDSKVLLRLEKDWQWRFQQILTRRSPRRSWVVRMFGCGSVED
ncbi:hypothetical protein CesoFtcFv8_001893 [Champsocephalus esox]|uniref:Uncharacterized protein n=2 Tax=Champsocephalus esox TaxID=159716 RepID=A0AAN8CXZ8_9TELE|nr:hypothetical protein CesoFtcFv8_001887 [Champsocephalus esox]KAK5911972.1 hypothetical protein CesoFtcFv8_001893 [Champsocephalus esox]